MTLREWRVYFQLHVKITLLQSVCVVENNFVLKRLSQLECAMLIYLSFRHVEKIQQFNILLNSVHWWTPLSCFINGPTSLGLPVLQKYNICKKKLIAAFLVMYGVYHNISKNLYARWF